MFAALRRGVDGGAVAQRARNAWQVPQFRHRVFLLAFLLVSLTAFGHIVEDYLTGDPLVRWDVSFASWLHEHSNPALVSAFKTITVAGNAAALALIVGAVAIVLVRRRLINDALLLIGVFVGIEILNAGLKLAFHRPRPELSFIHLDTYSFPSGHAAGATAVYGALVFLAATHAFISRRVTLVAVAVVLIALVDFSRLYLGAHYLSDVLAGSALGASWLAVCLLVRESRR